MIEAPTKHRVQLAIVGSGLAGFAASVFALDRGLTTAQIGSTGAIAYTTGYFDLLGMHDQALVSDPWDGLAKLRAGEPGHPLARIDAGAIRTAFGRFTEAVTEMGVGYTAPGERNLFALLPTGSAKPTCSVPRTMIAGVDALREKKRTLIVDFVGLHGFSAKEFAANFAGRWPMLSAARLGFPDMETGAEVFPEVMARALQVPANRVRLAERIGAVLGDAEAIGLPAVLGVHRPDLVHAEMERLTGVPVFEIPTMPPAVPGLRLREMFEQAFPARGLALVPQRKAERIDFGADGIDLHFHDNFGAVSVSAGAAILATGRFLSGGLVAARDGIRETLLDIPVDQPTSRDDWYREHYFDPRGHAINRCGVDVDDRFRPLGANGAPVDARLFAAGVLLSRQDWVRQRCGAGIAIATAYKAVEAVAELFDDAAVAAK